MFFQKCQNSKFERQITAKRFHTTLMMVECDADNVLNPTVLELDSFAIVFVPDEVVDDDDEGTLPSKVENALGVAALSNDDKEDDEDVTEFVALKLPKESFNKGEAPEAGEAEAVPVPALPVLPDNDILSYSIV